MARLVEVAGEDDCSVWIANLLSEDQDTWISSLNQLRNVTIADLEDPKHKRLPLIHKNKELVERLKSFLLSSSDPALRLDASIICATLLQKTGHQFNSGGLPTQIVNSLIDALTNNEDKLMLCSILIALGEAASSNNERS
eukprot:gene9061-9813_t